MTVNKRAVLVGHSAESGEGNTPGSCIELMALETLTTDTLLTELLRAI